MIRKKRANFFSELARNDKIILKYQGELTRLFNMANEIEHNCATNQKVVDKSPYNKNLLTFSISPDTLPYSNEKPFLKDIKLPEGIIYRIQLGAYSKPVRYDYFKGMQPISEEIGVKDKIIKYYVGLFNRYILADSSLKKITEYGFKEAFIVAYYNGNKIPVNRAKELEKDNF